MKIIKGDCLKILKKMESDSIDCVMTSPPYWGLRDYGVDGQLGQEKWPEQYIISLVEIFNEIKRVLKPTGTCWVNMGDTYQNKSLANIPAKFSIAMPASVKDRFTVDYEKLFFFTKTEKYYYEQQFQPLAVSTIPRYGRAVSEKIKYTDKSESSVGRLGKPRPNLKHTNPKQGGGGTGFIGHHGYFTAEGKPLFNEKGRNMRSVWKISTQPYKGAHFAVYPEELCRIPIQAGSPKTGTVLDPFMGSGTTLAVAEREGRNGIGIELKGEYIALAKQRIKEVNGKKKAEINRKSDRINK